ncbi:MULTISPECIES: type VI secretion system baseplate subunit TssE [unclassified Lysobacter]|uniref:type VI secretion system baseplate subunit TssE n=1 Tax=unclassified Lysobacter TaxID=2635362 RepID=UPI001BE93EE3|nr:MULTISPECIES: type VI secretion system baseplate subunit TssE [unclassified Lysobacter]MBT2744840.1 type VI secretion system baseplate subunit TssE [Lysobacter sp. ISL-42]MBT2752167.1 type VI secretion system baseplate subunit TssE [Lysobacter sp. ISL-50]MBT2778664.1 type VI secretion system baseplate subunit TssE [Lysobacter sp. ISL-54]MBT2780405.1 type VI secretion system baseplate subunit TssE [Lysobacter sp. ISL-52]
MQSLLDQLDQHSPPGDRRDVYAIRAAISRDLESLLNTRSEGARLIPDAFEECRKSSLTYGIPDFSSYSLLNVHDRDRIRRALEQAVALHEPRLTRVRISLEPQRAFERTLRFRIDALMELGPEREKVQFDAVLQLNTQVYQVR